MLQTLRNQASSWVIKILLGFLILSFAAWGIGDIFLGDRDPAVAKVGGIKLTRSQVNDEIREEMNRLQPMFGGRLDRPEADRMGITSQVLQNMINRTAVSLGANDLGITVSDQQVARRIQSDETFFNSRGQFDRAIFQQVLSRAGMSEGYYVASLKRDLAGAEIAGAIHAAVEVPDAITAPLVKFRSERRVAKAITVPDAPAGKIPDPTDAQVQTYYKANPQRFMAPPLRDVTFINLDPAAMAKDFKVSEERLKQGYQDRLDEFTTQDRRQVEQVVFRSEKAAEAAAKEIAAGKSLAQAAKEDGKPVKPVKLGWIAKADMLPELAGPVFALKKGEATKPIKTALGWHIVRVTDVEPGRVKPLSEVREQVRREVAQREASDAIYGLTNKLDDALAGGATLAEAAKNLGLTAVHVPALDARGRDASGNPVDGLPKGPLFLQTAFQTSNGQDSQIVDAQNGGFFVLHVNGVTPSKVRPLDAVKGDVVAAWKADQRAHAAELRAKAILDRLKNGDKLAAVAKAEKLAVTTTPAFTRLTHDSEAKLPAALMDKLFTLKVGEAAMAEGNKGYTVAVLDEIRPPSDKEKSDTADALTDEVRQGLAGDLFQEFVGALRSRYSITVNAGVLKEGS